MIKEQEKEDYVHNRVQSQSVTNNAGEQDKEGCGKMPSPYCMLNWNNMMYLALLSELVNSQTAALWQVLCGSCKIVVFFFLP